MAQLSNSPMQNVASAAGTVIEAGPKSNACKIFKKAVDDWCSTSPGKRQGKFNDYFFAAQKKALKDKTIKKKLCDPKTGETLVGVLLGGGKNGIPANFQQIMKAGGALGKKAQAVAARIANGTIAKAGTPGSRLGRAAKVRSCFKGTRVRRVLFADGVLSDGTILELKGPHDRENPRGQPKRYAKIAKNKKCLVVSCQSCGATKECNSKKCKRT